MIILFHFVPAEIVTDAKIEDFAGDWSGSQVSAYGMTAPLEMMEIEKLKLGIKDNLVTFTLGGGMLFGKYEIADLEGEFKDGVLTFTTPAEYEYSEDSVWNIRLHEDGTLSLSYTVMDEEFIFYLEPAVEETEESAEDTASEETTEDATEEAAE